MLSIQNLAVVSDMVRLPKETLQEMCTDLDLPSDGTASELAQRIWETISPDPTLQTKTLESSKHLILGGKTSVTWYHLENTNSLHDVKQLIRSHANFDPFERPQFPNREELTSTPTLISAAHGDNPQQIYLRFMYKSGTTREIYGSEISMRPKSAVCTAFIDEVTGLIEVRADPKVASKVAKEVAQLIRQQIAVRQVDLLAPFGHDVEQIADTLQGELIDTTSKPELLLSTFTKERASAVVEILSALDKYFDSGEIEVLHENLQSAVAAFGEEMLSVPFTALILAGLDKVGMGVADTDLRKTPLYEYLKPYLQHQGGFIRFTTSVDGVVQKYTIRVGLSSNSVFFVTPASENAIGFVRNHVIVHSRMKV